jgi:hypothetical protein
MDNNIVFTERQRFRQIWIWFILIGINGLCIYAIVACIIGEQQISNRPVNNTVLFVALGLTVLLTALFFTLRLDTEIKQDGIYVRFFPFHLAFRKYSRDEISKIFLRQYNPIKEYGGWGVRAGLFGKGKALNVSGHMGIQIVLTNGTRLLIGTNKPDEAKKVLQQLGYLTE